MKTLLSDHASKTELIKSAQRGDLEAFNLLIPRYQNLLMQKSLQFAGELILATYQVNFVVEMTVL
jgi:hypothetical protein